MAAGADVLLALHGAALGHLVEGVVAAVSLTLGLIGRTIAEAARRPLHILLLLVRGLALRLRVQRDVRRGDVLSILILLNIVYLYVIETIVEITDI